MSQTSGNSVTGSQVIILAGATAAGKSAVARELAEIMDIEIIVADSVQCYKYLDIGSNKPSEKDRADIPHHLVDFKDPTETLSSGQFAHLAAEKINEIIGRGKTPVVVGGTTLWIQWLAHGVPDAPTATVASTERAAAFVREHEGNKNWEAARAAVRELVQDKTRIDKIPANDWYRLRRYLEIELEFAAAAATSRAAASNSEATNAEPKPEMRLTGERNMESLASRDVRCFFLSERRIELYRRIDRRCLEMLQQGLLEENTALVASQRVPADSMAARAIGYRQVSRFLGGLAFPKGAHNSNGGSSGSSYSSRSGSARGTRDNQNMAVALELQALFKEFCAATRQYAHRQLHWYRGDSAFLWLQIEHVGERKESEAQSCRAVVREMLHWLAAPRAEYEATLRRQRECGECVTAIRNARRTSRGRKKRRTPPQDTKESVAEEQQSAGQSEDSWTALEEKERHTVSSRHTLPTDHEYYGLCCRALVETGELPDKLLPSSAQQTAGESSHSQWTALGTALILICLSRITADPLIRASEGQFSSKELARYSTAVSDEQIFHVTSFKCRSSAWRPDGCTDYESSVVPELRTSGCSSLVERSRHCSLVLEKYPDSVRPFMES